jgi:hypothetical protein
VSENQDWVYGVENWQDANSSLQNPAWYAGDTGSIGELVYRLFAPSYFQSWEAFASTKMLNANPGSDYLSVEYIHNNIHVSFTMAGILLSPTNSMGALLGCILNCFRSSPEEAI